MCLYEVLVNDEFDDTLLEAAAAVVAGAATSYDNASLIVPKVAVLALARAVIEKRTFAVAEEIGPQEV